MLFVRFCCGGSGVGIGDGNGHSQQQGEYCGGYDAFDLYELEWAEEPDHEEYVGCYADTSDQRVMTNMLVDQYMTTHMCRNHCQNTGAEYYGTQVG